MTTRTTRSLAASSAHTPIFEQVIGRPAASSVVESAPQPAKVICIGQYIEGAKPTPARHIALGDLVSRWAKDGSRDAAMANARRWLADVAYEGEGNTVRTLRLGKGLSQARLAEAIGTSQPHIARIERGTENVTIDTCRRLAAALGVDMNTLDQALSRQEALAGARSGPR